MDKNDNRTKIYEKAIKVLKKLHEYLPDYFPEAEQIGHFIFLKELEGQAHFTIGGGGELRVRSDPFTQSKIGFESLVILNFVVNFNGDPHQDFTLAGLPFRFHIDRFIRKYLGATSRLRLEEILELLGVKSKTYHSYISTKQGSFKDDQLDELIKDVFERKEKKELTANSLAKWIGINEPKLIGYLKTHQTHEIIYLADKKRVIYRKMSSNKERQEE